MCAGGKVLGKQTGKRKRDSGRFAFHGAKAGWRQASGRRSRPRLREREGPASEASGRDSPAGAYRSGGLLPQALSDAMQSKREAASKHSDAMQSSERHGKRECERTMQRASKATRGMARVSASTRARRAKQPANAGVRQVATRRQVRCEKKWAGLVDGGIFRIFALPGFRNGIPARRG